MDEIKRIDLVLLERGLASSRTKSQDLIRKNKVYVSGKLMNSPGSKIPLDAEIQLVENEYPYVSRGGLKLQAALDAFQVELGGKRALDIGISTGGFTHCLLLNGIESVLGIDVGTKQLHEDLRNHPQLTYLENQDFRKLDPSQTGTKFSFFVIDVSFISLRLIFPHLPKFLEQGSCGIVLVKPQYEVGPANIGGKGVARNNAARDLALSDVDQAIVKNGFFIKGKIPSPILGGEGNEEFLLYLEYRGVELA